MLKLFKYLEKYKVSLLVVLVLLFFQAISQLYLPTLMANIVDTGIVYGDTNYILKVGGVMIVVAAIGAICTVVASLLSSKISVGYGRDLRNMLFERVESYSLSGFDKFGTASLITRTTNDINQVQQVVIIMLRMIVTAPLMCIGGIIMAVSKDAKLSLLILVLIPILALTIFLITRRGIPLFKVVQKKLDALNLVLREKLTGVRVIRAFNRDKYEEKRFNEKNKDLTDISIKVNKIMAGLMPALMIILNLATVAILWFGSIRVGDGNMEVGNLMAFVQYVMQIMFALIMVSMMFVLIPRASASAVRINEVLEESSTIKDPENYKEENKMKGYLEFKNITYSYEGAETPAIEDISFSAKPGEVTAIIGGTGSGKSTLINLIPRFYDAQNGSILVDGIDIKDMNQETLRKKIGLVPQKAVLFTGTIEDNIKYGKEDANLNEIKHSAKIAQALEFIQEMNDGFNHVISQGGNNLSGGQKQRLSIARALVRKPEIYIFDDSFSALDFKTDAKLRSALKNETKESTVIIVAQRVSTVMDADRIIVLDEGQIKGIGKHKELLNSCDVYREIVESQLSKEEIA